VVLRFKSGLPHPHDATEFHQEFLAFLEKSKAFPEDATEKCNLTEFAKQIPKMLGKVQSTFPSQALFLLSLERPMVFPKDATENRKTVSYGISYGKTEGFS